MEWDECEDVGGERGEEEEREGESFGGCFEGEFYGVCSFVLV